MSTRNHISAAGTIMNLLKLGFTLQDALQELLDNSIDAKALRIRIILDPRSSSLIVSDTGFGMTCDMLLSALCINHTKPASESIGLRGAGLKASHCVLSDEAYPTRLLSKTDKDATVNEIIADWPEAIAKDTWNPTPRTGENNSRKGEELWDMYCIDPAHGTVAVIPMPESRFVELSKSLPQLLKDVGRTYEIRIAAGLSIVVSTDGQEYVPDMSSALGWDTASVDMRKEQCIEIWENPDTHECRGYYTHEDKMLRPNPSPDQRKRPVDDYANLSQDGFVCLGKGRLLSVFKPEWNPPRSESGERPVVPGYIGFIRNDRGLNPLPMVYAKSGDMEKQRWVEASRHAFVFDHQADGLVGIEVNKSRVTPKNICPTLLSLIERRAKSAAEGFYTKAHPKERKATGDAAFERHMKRVMALLKQRAAAYGEDFLADLEAVVADWDGEEEEEEATE